MIEETASIRLQNAIYQTYAERDCLTGDVGGSSSTGEFTDAVIRHL